MNLKELARTKGTNLKQVAEKCGIPPTTLYAISRGDTNFDNVGINTAIKVARELGMTVEELYLGEEHSLDQASPIDGVEDSILRASTNQPKHVCPAQACFFDWRNLKENGISLHILAYLDLGLTHDEPMG